MNQNEINQNEEVTKGRNIKLWIVLAILSLCAVFFAIFLWGDKAENHAYANEEAEIEVAANHASVESMETEATSNIVEETSIETTAPESSEETQIETEYEITDWTMEELLSDVEINGVKLSLPCSYEELAEHFDLELDLSFYNEAYKKYYYGYALRGDLYILTGYYSENETDNPSAEGMDDFYISCENGAKFRFGEIVSGVSTREDVEKILGKPNFNSTSPSGTWYKWIGLTSVLISYDKNNKVDCIHCFWEE